jgi:16S rRNA processing protein RimM
MQGLVPVGRVGRPHGLDGSFFVEEASEDPERFAVGARLIAGEDEVSVVSSKRAAGGRIVIRLDRGVERGTTLAVPRAELAPAEEGGYYVFELVGLDVEEEGGRPLGVVQDVAAGVANDVLELDNGHALPLVAQCVLDVDLERRRILVARGFTDPD